VCVIVIIFYFVLSVFLEMGSLKFIEFVKNFPTQYRPSLV
jgi:hypothetical protein